VQAGFKLLDTNSDQKVRARSPRAMRPIASKLRVQLGARLGWARVQAEVGFSLCSKRGCGCNTTHLHFQVDCPLKAKVAGWCCRLSSRSLWPGGARSCSYPAPPRKGRLQEQQHPPRHQPARTISLCMAAIPAAGKRDSSMCAQLLFPFRVHNISSAGVGCQPHICSFWTGD
jgi:hypothetical protein